MLVGLPVVSVGGGGEPAERLVGPVGVVLDSPVLERGSGVDAVGGCDSEGLAMSSSTALSSLMRGRSDSEVPQPLTQLGLSATRRQRRQVDPVISRWRRTSLRSPPDPSIRPPSRTLRTACPGV